MSPLNCDKFIACANALYGWLSSTLANCQSDQDAYDPDSDLMGEGLPTTVKTNTKTRVRTMYKKPKDEKDFVKKMEITYTRGSS